MPTPGGVPVEMTSPGWRLITFDKYATSCATPKTMVFGVAQLVAYLSKVMSLQPGDVISTGTPPGVGMGVKPSPIYLKAGQTMRLGIQGLGEQQQRTVDAK